uniref:Uncharacterized protein n=1 Tax=Panagrolaimus superbus TaxID=310955 RepID=A0A914XYT2_9BILA
MSSIRKALPPTKNKLRRLITEAKEIQVVMDPSDKNGIKGTLEKFTMIKMDIRQSLRTINASVSQWEDLIEDLTGQEKTTEQDLLDVWLTSGPDADNPTGLDQLIADALQSLGELQYNIEEMDAILHPRAPAVIGSSQFGNNSIAQSPAAAVGTTTKTEVETTEQVNSTPPELGNHCQQLKHSSIATGSTPATPCSVKLPDLKPYYFDGNILNWLPFEDYFLTHIDAQPLADVTKLAYLLDSLHGPTKKAVQGTSCSASNYRVIWNKLKARFGDVSIISTTLQLLLSEISPCSDNAKTFQMRQVFDLMENYLNQLEILH